MADTPLEFRWHSGQTITADLVSAADASLAAGLAATELTNGKGRYRVTYSGAGTGGATLHPIIGGAYVTPVFDYSLKDTTDVHYPLDTGVGLLAAIGVPVALDGGAATIAGMLTKLADDNAGGDFDATSHSLVAVSSRQNRTAYPADATVEVAVAATDALRGDALVAAYTAAKSLTPGGAAISVTNRATVLIPPGRYLLSATLDLDAEGVDLVAIDPVTPPPRRQTDADPLLTPTDLSNYRPTNVDIYTTTDAIDTVEQSVANVRLRGVSIAQLSTDASNGYSAFNVSAVSNAGSEYDDCCFFVRMPFFGSRCSVEFAQDVDGIWLRCVANALAWRVAHDVGDAGQFKATMYDCTAGAYSFIGDYPSGREGTHKATGCRLVRCQALGTYYNKSSGYASFSGCQTWGCDIDNTCWFIDCVAGDNSFGLGSDNAGNFIRCRGGAYTFGSTMTDSYPANFSGYAEDCVAGAGSFGGGDSDGAAFGKLSGHLVRCVVTGSEVPTRIEGATIEDCLLTVGTANQDCITLLDSASRIHNSTLLVVESGTGVPINAGSALNVSAAGNRYNNSDTTASGLGANVTNLGIHSSALPDGAIKNATFAADVGSTAYASNIIALAVRKVLDEVRLDHLVAVADADDVVDNSIIAKMVSKAATADWSTYVSTTDSQEATRDAIVGVLNACTANEAYLVGIQGVGFSTVTDSLAVLQEAIQERAVPGDKMDLLDTIMEDA